MPKSKAPWLQTKTRSDDLRDRAIEKLKEALRLTAHAVELLSNGEVRLCTKCGQVVKGNHGAK